MANKTHDITETVLEAAGGLVSLTKSIADYYGVDPNIAVKQINAESSFNPNAVSKSHPPAQGLAQFIPGTWAIYGEGDPFDPEASLHAYGKYMKHLLTKFDGRYDLALAGYNWGENRNVLQSALNNGDSVLNYNLPTETRNYVKKILGS